MTPPARLALTLIVAATPSLGIGKNGTLPWPQLKKEMAYFARVTKRVPTSSIASPTASTARNAVIMGRKTWESIPPRFRPLKDRINIIVSRDPSKIEGVQLLQREGIKAEGDPAATPVAAGSLEEAVEKLRGLGAKGGLGRVYVIGGAQLYGAALRMQEARYVLLTRVWREYECDTVFPVDVVGPEGKGGEGWVRKSNGELSEFVGETIEAGRLRDGKDGEEVEFEFCLFERL
ncbi:dihydrofolate reductase-like domain-containing protein [Macrophomina phaseolina]|nr:dihydrofolate reductase-like domain-containing protein [Macrophomina phaseolina]